MINCKEHGSLLQRRSTSVRFHRRDATDAGPIRKTMSLKQPVNQVRLTNVAVVRLKRKGKRFELACYKNKVLSWREGNEKDIDEVLQTESVFTNVSKGVLAKAKDLKLVFGTDDTKKILDEILRKGELQVSERERQYQSDNLFNEIAGIVTAKCVDPETKRPFSLGVIERAMKETIHYAVMPGKNAKTQAQTVIKLLAEHMSISRAQMRVRIDATTGKGKVLKEKLNVHVASWEEIEWDAGFEATVLIDPGNYRPIEEILRAETKGQGTLEVQDVAVVEGEEQ